MRHAIALCCVLVAFSGEFAASAEPMRRPVDPWNIFANASKLEVISLDPTKNRSDEDNAPIFREAKKEETEKGFHGWHELGRTVIDDAKSRDRIKSSISAWITVVQYGEGALCFEPRHAIRVVHEGVTVDLVICFHCNNFQMFVTLDQSTQKEAEKTEALLDGVLKSAKIEIAPKAKSSKDDDDKAASENEKKSKP